MNETIRLAVPNKGRLEAPTAALLRQAGLRYEKTARALAVPVRNIDLELLFVRTEDVCELVEDGVAQLGVTGLDLLAERESGIGVVTELGYGRCALTAAVPNASPVGDIAGFEGLRVATSHPRVTEAFFGSKGISVTTVPLRGSVEVAPKLDVADAVADLVSSGSTMLINGLRPVATVLESQAVMIAGEGVLDSNNPIPGRLATMFRAVVAARRKRYVLMNAPASSIDAIEKIIPGLNAPTVIPLAHDSMVAIHSVVDTDSVHDVLPRLEEAGASGILVLPIEQLIP